MIADLQSLPQEVIAEELLWRKARSFKDDPLGFDGPFRGASLGHSQSKPARMKFKRNFLLPR